MTTSTTTKPCPDCGQPTALMRHPFAGVFPGVPELLRHCTADGCIWERGEAIDGLALMEETGLTLRGVADALATGPIPAT